MCCLHERSAIWGANHIGCKGACVGLRVRVQRLRCTNLGHIYCWNLTCTIVYCTLLTWWWHVTYLTPMCHLGTCVHMWKHTCKVCSNEPWNMFHLVITHSHVGEHWEFPLGNMHFQVIREPMFNIVCPIWTHFVLALECHILMLMLMYLCIFNIILDNILINC